LSVTLYFHWCCLYGGCRRKTSALNIFSPSNICY